MSKYQNMSSEEFNLEIIKKIIEKTESMACKLEGNRDEIAQEAEDIIYDCLERLKNLISQ